MPNFIVGTTVQTAIVGSFASAFSASGLDWNTFNLKRHTFKPCGMTRAYQMQEKEKREGMGKKNESAFE
jgi:hypothetical protein